ncbi:Sec61beta family protein [Ancylostoma ceylanicum]|uniref:Sec61beta family protein n=1 Tax=Ancylostoma ceylanicum TaxID=53326 RepID=A0A0D6LX49_9BILA|nr:Sec61beta family protein [Ancylostoma ceylanicum]
MSDTGRSPRPAGSQLRQRRGGGAATASSGRPRAGNSGGLWRFYTEDSTGLKIGPVPVLVMSLVFIASVGAAREDPAVKYHSSLDVLNAVSNEIARLADDLANSRLE